MIRASARRTFALVVTAVLGLSLVSALSAAPAGAATELSDRSAAAFSQISSCVAERGSLLASIVVDDSASLKRSDPQEQRAAAVTAIVDSLAELATAAGSAVSVEANLAVFGSRYEPLVGWGPPTGDHGDQLRSTASERLRNRQAAGAMAQQTDYRVALRNAQAAIDERASELPARPCSIILWFTDGRLDVDFPNPIGAASEAARDEICRAGGIADGIRDAGTHVVALALFSDDPSIAEEERVSEAEREKLRAVAEGVGTGAACGSDPLANDTAAGAYLSASDPGQLRRLFAGTGALMQGGTPRGSALPNDDGTIEIAVDAAIGKFRLIFESKDDGPVNLVSPDGGQTFDLRQATGSATGVSLDSTGRDGLYTSTVTGHGGALVGTWTIRAAPSTVTLLDLYYFWDADLRIEAPDGLVLGQQNTVTIAPSRDGIDDDPAWYSTLDVTARVDGTDVPVTANADGSRSVTVDLTADGARTAVRIEAVASGTTAGHGIEVGPVTRAVELATSLPVGFPTVTPAALDFGRFDHASGADATLTLRGVSEGESSVCIGVDPVWDRSPQQATLALTNDVGGDGCVVLGVDETRVVTLRLSSEAAAEGSIAGTVPATFRGANTDESHELQIPVTASMFRPVDESTRWLLVIGFTFGALLLAWLVASVARHVADRYRLHDLRFASVPVLLSREGLTRTAAPAGSEGRTSSLVSVDDFHQAKDVTSHEFTLGGLTWRRRGPKWFPYTPYSGQVSAESPVATVTPPATLLGRSASAPVIDARTAPVEFPGTQHAYLVADPQPVEAGQAISGRLVLLVEGESGSISSRLRDWNAVLTPGMSGVNWGPVDAALRTSLQASAHDPGDGVFRRRERAPRKTNRPAPTTPATSGPPAPVPGPDYFGAGLAAPQAPPPAGSARLPESRSPNPQPSTDDVGGPPSYFG